MNFVLETYIVFCSKFFFKAQIQIIKTPNFQIFFMIQNSEHPSQNSSFDLQTHRSQTYNYSPQVSSSIPIKVIRKAPKKPWYKKKSFYQGGAAFCVTALACAAAWYFGVTGITATQYDENTDKMIAADNNRKYKSCEESVQKTLDATVNLTLFEDLPYDPTLYEKQKTQILNLIDDNQGRSLYLLEGPSQIG